jgi:hypothetical protein
MVVALVGLFAIGVGVSLGIVSLFGVGRPAGERYKAPWITLALGGALLLLVGAGALTAAFRGSALGTTAVAGSPAAAWIDHANAFRLDDPGQGWTIMSKENLRTMNESAAAGAHKGPNLGGFVFVEIADPDFRIADHEREIGNRIIDQIELDHKQVVFIRPDELEGQKAVRCQLVGTIAGRGIRYEIVAFVANGRVYRLVTLAASDQTSEDGLAFRPFIAAFHLLPPEPPAATHAPAPRSAAK